MRYLYLKECEGECKGRTPHSNGVCMICASPEVRMQHLDRELYATIQALEMAVTDGEGPESEEEMSQAKAEKTVVSPQGTIPWLNPGVVGRSNAPT